MLSANVRNLGNWDARDFVRWKWRWGVHDPRNYDFAAYRYHNTRSVAELYKLPFLLRNAVDMIGIGSIGGNFATPEDYHLSFSSSSWHTQRYNWNNRLVQIRSHSRPQ